VHLAVHDSGPGIDPAEREAVFLRFHRTESSRHLPGNGLGLSLVAAVARLHGLQVAILGSEQGCHIALRTEAATAPLLS
jgi:signal transduction histidine kinase